MASCSSLLLLLLCLVLYFEGSSCFVELDCDIKSTGQVNHQSTLQCVVRPTEGTTGVKIVMVKWMKAGVETPILKFTRDLRSKPGYRFAESSWNRNNVNVSLLISETKVADEGEYTCDVVTDSGVTDSQMSLTVTAKYGDLSLSRVEETETPNSDEALRCRAAGGYPEGHLRWFDENKVEWTKSAKSEVKTMDNGLIELVSRLPLLPGSTFLNYTCVLFNSSGGKEKESFILVPAKPPKTDSHSGSERSQTSNIVAPVVVIGSLIVGLLLALLIYKRRSGKDRRPSTTPLVGSHREVPTLDLEEGAIPPKTHDNLV